MEKWEFDYLREYVRREAAISIEPGKEYLVRSRLRPVLESEDIPSLAALIGQLRGTKPGHLGARVVEALTTNETSFFRDRHPFTALRETVIPDLIRERSAERSLHVWCAACSTGQEPFSIAMLLLDAFPELARWNVRVIATDLDTQVLERARAGAFSQLEVNRGLPAPYLVKFFRKDGAVWRLDPRVRDMVEFSSMNLAAAWPPLPRVDLVFMRNVLIYFEVETRSAIISRVKGTLRPDGYLFLGGSETMLGIDDSFERIKIGSATCYRALPREALRSTTLRETAGQKKR